ncbi:hypothetical protein HYR99_29450, partial [Candidatus Poribacteria bacterium]|nr:hypothetical protein [Candidatus Poribacteria bacterium]
MLKSKIRLASSIVADIFLINLAFLCAYYTCKSLGLNLLESLKEVPIGYQSPHLFLMVSLVVTGFRLSSFFVFQLYKPVWRYASVQEFLSLVGAISLGTLALIFVLYIGGLFNSWLLFLIDGLYNIVFVGLAKFSWRIVGDCQRKQVATPRTRVLIVGAGEAGVGVLRDIRHHPEKGYIPVGFIDDDLEKVGKSIQRLDVLGTTRELAYIARKRGVDEIVMAMPSASGSRIREIIRQCEYKGCKFKIVPSIHAILAGHVSIS